MMHISIPQPQPVAGVCGGCAELIQDQYYLMAADRCWHLDCLQCCICNSKLDRDISCFSRNGLIYCKVDYYRQFATQCARCTEAINYKELVMRAKHFTYHLACFMCNICGTQLSPGQYFAVNPVTGVLFCQIHYEPLLCGGQPLTPYGVEPGDLAPCLQSGEEERNYSSSSSLKAGRPKKKKSSQSRQQLIQGQEDGSELSNGGMGQSYNHKTKRMRTSFKHHQLKAMKAYFALNHNPDAKDLKQLAQRTGLTKRVLQVWFQNARAKYRRSVGQSGGSSSNGDPLRSEGEAQDPESQEEFAGMHDPNSPSQSSLEMDENSLPPSPGGELETTSLSSAPESAIGTALAVFALKNKPESEEPEGSSLAEYFKQCESTFL